MNTVDWNRVRELFDSALELEPSERAGFLEEACPDDPALQAEVVGLLTADSSTENFLRDDFGTLVALPQGVQGPTVGGRIGPFVLEKVIASGGMGVVFQAAQDSPRRRVALKTLRSGYWTEDQVRRFRTEVEVLGMLQHSSIAQIYEAGTHDEHGVALPYFAMELVSDAKTVLEHANAQDLDLRARLRLFCEVCEAVQYGHSKGIIHRDIKPGNVLVDGQGRVKVIDFGLARVVGPRAASLSLSFAETQTGHVMGTLPYMSPEHLSSTNFEVDVQSDVYSLGCLLHELLAGRTPTDFAGLALPAAIVRVERGEPDIDPDLPQDLRWVLTRALERNPKRRYASVVELTAEIGRFLRHEPVLAGAPSRTYRMLRFARRNRTVLVSTAAVIAALSVGLVLSQVALASEKRAHSFAESERQMMEKVGFVMGFFVAELNPITGGRDARIVDVMEELVVPRLDATQDPRVLAYLRGWVGQGYMNLREFEAAEQYLAPAWAAARDLFPIESAHRMNIATVYADLLERMGRPRESAELSEELLPIAERVFGPAHQRATYLRYNLAICLGRLGDPSRGEALLRENHRYYQEQSDGVHHVLIRKDIGGMICDQGRLDEAGDWYAETHELAVQEYGAGSPAAATVALELASVRLKQSRFDDAEELLRGVALDFEGAPPSPQNQLLLRALQTELHLSLNQFEEVESDLERFAAVIEASGVDPGELGAVLAHFRADLARRRGDADARELAEAAFELASAALEPLNKTRLEAAELLASVWADAGEQARALELLSRIENEIDERGASDGPALRLLRKRRAELAGSAAAE